MGCCVSAVRIRGVLIAMFVLAAAGPLVAQAPDPPLPTAGYQDGFFVQSANGDNRLLFGLVARWTGAFRWTAPPPITNTFTIRKVRAHVLRPRRPVLRLQGHAGLRERHDAIHDAYFDVRFSPKFRIRVGQGQDAGRLRAADWRRVPAVSRTRRWHRAWSRTATSAFRRRAI